VDRSLLPDIFALTVFIAGFRPLASRVGAHANLWFIGWGFVLLQHVALLFDAPAGLRHTIVQLVATLAIDLSGLIFLNVSANVPTVRIGPKLMVEFSVPVLLQSALYVLGIHKPAAQLGACVLFLAPAVHMVLRPRQRNHPMIVVTGAFAVYGLVTLPVVLHNPRLAVQGSLALIFLSAGYFFFVSAEHYSRGVLAAVAGLIGWGLSFPAVMAFVRYFPGVAMDRALVELPQYFVVVGIMLTLLEEHVERTERLAMHDPLTDLPNRRLFEERLIATMEEARINRTTVACLVIDVDNFKHINDTLGHEAGDQLLRALAVRLSWHMSPRDILARTGGDEFTALLAGVSDEHHLRFIASAMMSAGSVPITIDGNPVDVRISIGIALSPDHADDIDSLRRAADEAMYSAKRRGGSMLAFADED
jgi:diguanylate cyclase (GGDEF)-like protein